MSDQAYMPGMVTDDQKNMVVDTLVNLPQELVDEVVRFAVTKKEIIDLRYLEMEVGRLLAPFAKHKGLMETASKEVMRLNTFSLSLGDTYSHVPRETQQLRELRGVKLKSLTQSGARLWSDTTTDISLRHAEIQHLECRTTIMLKGANMDKPRPVESTIKQLGIPWLHEWFPKLKTLKVVVESYGTVVPDASDPFQPPRIPSHLEVPRHARLPPSRSGHWYHLPGHHVLFGWIDVEEPACASLRQDEIKLQMEDILINVGTVTGPCLQQKSVEFIHSKTDSSSKTFVGDDFLLPYSERPDNWCRQRQLTLRSTLMSALIIGRSQQSIRDEAFLMNGLEVTYADIAQETKGQYVEKNLEAIKQMMQCPRAVVDFPCSGFEQTALIEPPWGFANAKGED